MKDPLSKRYLEALAFAFDLHQGQRRKDTEIPYLSHLLSVSALVMENGGDEDQAIAALLHDAVEDQGGLDTLENIRERFGRRVAGIVDGCTDAYTNPKPPWKERKLKYLRKIEKAGPETQLVSLADKVHNARSILNDLQQIGPSSLDVKFKGGRTGTVWYYRSLADIFDRTEFTALKNELRQLVDQIGPLAETGE